MRPHGDFCGEVDKFEVGGHSLKLLARFSILDSNFEESIVEAWAIGFFEWGGGELLIRWEERRGDIVRKEPAVGDEVAEADEVAVLDGVAKTFHRYRRNDLPEVVGVVVRVPSDLLALRRYSPIFVAQRIFVDVRVQIYLGFLVAHSDVVKVVDPDGLLRH